MRILITGSRYWTDYSAVEAAILSYIQHLRPEAVTIVHGGAPGADTCASQVARKYGLREEVHPAEWEKHGKAAGPIRNRYMVSLGADVCLAFPLGRSLATRGCMDMAECAGIWVRNFERRTDGHDWHGGRN